MSDAVNLRIDPRTGESNYPAAISETFTVAEFEELPGVFGVLLTQRPHPTEIEVYHEADPSVPLTRVTTVTEPSIGRFWSDSAQLNPRGYIIVNSSYAGDDLTIVYRPGGYLAHKRNLETVIPEGPPGPPGGVDTVFTRSGDVVAETGDYTQDQVTDGSTYKQYSATEKTKLSGIATGADVTNTAINATNKATFHDNDRFAGANSESSNATVYWLWSAIKAVFQLRFSAKSAWCKFDGTASDPITIAAGFGVTNVTKNSSGDYTVNFSTAFTDANYAACVTVKGDGGAPDGVDITSQSTTAFRFNVKDVDGYAVNCSIVNVIVFGN